MLNNNSRSQRIDNSTIEGPIINGDLHIHPTTREIPNNSIATLIKVISAINDDQIPFDNTASDLDYESYISDHPVRPQIGLEKKLESGLRNDMIEDALFQRNLFERLLQKQVLNSRNRLIYMHVFTFVVTVFNSEVRSLILAGADNSTVDNRIKDYIILPLTEILQKTNPNMTSQHILGILHALTGRCHIVWSK